jgi:V/A-type H+-transporting ATPase subunit E
MAGVQNITDEILQDAHTQCVNINKEAEDNKNNLISQAKEEIAVLSDKAKAKAKADSDKYIEKIMSQANTNERRAALDAKAYVIKDILNKAYEKIISQSDSDYFSMIYSLVGKTCYSEDGEILISASDRKRLPSDFESKVNAEAKKKGGSLKLSDKDADIDGGFILKYGGIDENCSIKSIFDEKHTDMQDLVYNMLWPKE